MRRALVVVALLVGSLLVVSPVQAAERTVDLHYGVELLSAEEGTYRIEARFSGLDDGDVISKFTFHASRYDAQYTECTNLTVAGRSHSCSTNVNVTVDGDTLTYSYEANLDQQAASGGYNSRTEATWAVLQAGGIGFQFSYTHPSTITPVFDPTMSFDLPEGWKADASFPQEGGRFQLEPAFPRPAGIIVLGEFERTRFSVLGSDAVYAEVEPADVDIPRLINATADYLASTHGNVIGPKVLFVSAPGPFKEGGVATRDGFAVHDGAPAQTVVHEWVHLFQRFEICNVPQGRDCFPPASREPTDESGASVWIKEGGAEYFSALALYAGGEWSVSRTQTFFDEVDERYKEAPLDEAVYGSSVQRAAYTKGALTLARADEILRQASGKTVDLGTVMRDLNAYVQSELQGESPRDITETNDDFQARLEDHADHDWAGFFDDYVESEQDPGPYEFDPTGSFRFSDLRVTPEPVVAGANLSIAVNVTNNGLERDETTFRFFVDGEVVAERSVALDPGESTRAEASLTAPDPGEIRVEVATLGRSVTVHAPAQLELGEIGPRPGRPEAGTPYAVEVAVVNDGGVAGTGSVALAVANATVGTRPVTVEGGATATVRFLNVTSPEGPVTARAELTFDGETTSREASWTVQSKAILDSETLREIPAPGVALVAAAALAATLWRKR